jgi:membrane protease YdiL (CAAX protease family)
VGTTRPAARRRGAPPEPSLRPAADGLALAALVLAYGATSQQAESAGWQVPANLAAGAAAVAAARARGSSWDVQGLDPLALPGGLRLGVTTLVPVGAVVALGIALPSTRPLFVDERVHGAGARTLAYHALVRIPLATALAEELLFRSALLGIELRSRSRRRAVAMTAIAFGLWHVLPALRSHESNPAGAELASRAGGRAATVAVTVGATAAAGAGLAWLRLRSRSVAAPFIAHAGVNLAAFAAATCMARRARSARR